MISDEVKLKDISKDMRSHPLGTMKVYTKVLPKVGMISYSYIHELFSTFFHPSLHDVKNKTCVTSPILPLKHRVQSFPPEYV